MGNIDEIKQLIKDNGYCNRHYIEIKKLESGYAELEMTVHDDLLNIYGSLQGGELFTLADQASGMAGFASGHQKIVTLSGNLNYIKSARCKKCIAVAEEIHKGRQTGVYDVTIKSEEGILLAKATFSMFFK